MKYCSSPLVVTGVSITHVLGKKICMRIGEPPFIANPDSCLKLETGKLRHISTSYYFLCYL